METAMVKIFLLLAANVIVTMEAFTEPFVNLRCEAGVAMSGHLVNVTWTTKDNQLPNDVRPHLQNCQASIDCTNGYSRESGCPYFTSTGLNGGWEFQVPFSETSCAATVSVVDINDPFSTVWSTTERCNLIPVSTAILDDQIVGDPVSLQCNTTTMASIHSQVEIMWMRNNKTITNNDRITVTDTIRNNSHTSRLHFSYLTEDDDGLYTCVVKIPGTESETVSQSLELGNFSVPRLTVDVSKKHSVDVLECNATTVRGVTSSATFVWKSNDQEVDRANVSGTSIDNSTVFTHTFSAHGEETDSSITVYKCYVEINAKRKVNATGEMAINHMTITKSPTLMPTSDKPTNITTESDTPTEDEVMTTVTSPFCSSPSEKKTLPEVFKDPPIINLTCTQQYVNVTWIPVECYRPTEVEDRLQNCQASIRCDNGNWINRRCPYFSSTGLNGGWQWDVQEVSSCIVKVSFVDTYDPFSSLLTQTASCNIISSNSALNSILPSTTVPVISPSTTVPVASTSSSFIQNTSTMVIDLSSSLVQSSSTLVVIASSSPVQSTSIPVNHTPSSLAPSASPPVTSQPGFSTPGAIIGITVGFVIFVIVGFIGFVIIRNLLQNHILTGKGKISKSDTIPANIPSVFNDTGSYIALGRDTASTCENINDVKLWIEKSQIWSINEECTSILSENLTDAEMLNYILNQRSQDSGKGSSVPYFAESELSEMSIGKTVQCFWEDTNQVKNTEETFDGNNENKNNDKLQHFQCDNACGVFYPIPEYEPAQNLTISKISLDVAKGLMTTPIANYIDYETVFKQDVKPPQTNSSSSKQTDEAVDTPCTLSHQHTENNLNLSSENFMHQQSIDSSKDGTFVNANSSPIEVVKNCNIDDSVSNISHLDKKSVHGVHKDILPTELTVMAGAYVQHDAVLEAVTFQPHPSLTDNIINDTESTADETFGLFVDSTAAMEQTVVSTCEDDASAPSSCSQDVSTGNSTMHDMAVTTEEYTAASCSSSKTVI